MQNPILETWDKLAIQQVVTMVKYEKNIWVVTEFNWKVSYST